MNTRVMKLGRSIFAVAMCVFMAVCFLVPADLGWAAESSEPTVIRVVSDGFRGQFSPFFSETANDAELTDLTSINLIKLDRLGLPVLKGIKGEARSYEGREYTYFGPADVEVTLFRDGTVHYDFKLREDLKFSDGTPVTADDVIFSMYVLADPLYDGFNGFGNLPIKGIEKYKAGVANMLPMIYSAGRDNSDFSLWSRETQAAFWSELDKAGAAFAQEIVDYCIEAGFATDVQSAAEAWGYYVPANATAKDFFYAIADVYEGDFASLSSYESVGSSLQKLGFDPAKYSKPVMTGESAANIEGIIKIDDYSFSVILTEMSASAIYSMAIPISPLHYYGDESKYNYDANKFGFDKGDISTIHAKDSKPMGAGPYKFINAEGGNITLGANDNYYLGKPVTDYLQFIDVGGADGLDYLEKGKAEICRPVFSNDSAASIKDFNGGELSGDKLITDTMDHLGYGYIGMSANVVKVGNEPGSDASKNLRKALATTIAAYRQDSIDNFYGEAAEVLEYPISNSSWAAPQKTDEGYETAFSKDVNGDPIYFEGMTEAQRKEALKEAVLGYFAAAGYTVNDGKVTAAPEGASLKYEVMIPADGNGNHPSFLALTKARDLLEEIGFELEINDLSNSADLWASIEAESIGIWAASWGVTSDPDMYQIYYSGLYGEQDPGGSSYMYDIADKELDELVLKARKSTDQDYRKTTYRKCLDIIMDWAVEIPMYQRQNAYVFSAERLDKTTIPADISEYYNWMAEAEKIRSLVPMGEVPQQVIALDEVAMDTDRFIYNGKEQIPTIEVYDEFGNYVDPSDYDVTYPAASKNIGCYTITVAGKGNYTGEITFDYYIVGDLSKTATKVTVAKIADKIYTGSAIKPTPTVKAIGASGKVVTLKNKTDYTLNYSKNKEIGKATVTIKGKGNYTGSKKVTFKILPKKVTGLKLTSPKSKQLKVVYTKSPGGVKYKVAYRVKGTTSWKTVTVTGTSKLLKSLKGGKTYQVRVKAFKKVDGTTYEGAWTAIKSLKVKK